MGSFVDVVVREFSTYRRRTGQERSGHSDRSVAVEEARRSDIGGVNRQESKSRYPAGSSGGRRESTSPPWHVERQSIDWAPTMADKACGLRGENHCGGNPGTGGFGRTVRRRKPELPAVAPVRSASSGSGTQQAVHQEVSSTTVALSSPVLVDFEPHKHPPGLARRKPDHPGGVSRSAFGPRLGPDQYWPGEPATCPDRQPR